MSKSSSKLSKVGVKSKNVSVTEKIPKPRIIKSSSLPTKKIAGSVSSESLASSTTNSSVKSNSTQSEIGLENTLKTPDPSSLNMSKLNLTKPAPDFRGTALVDGEFKEIKLSDYKGKYLVFFFYPADFTFVCPTELIAFSERTADFRKIDCEVLACSTDSHFSHFAWLSTPRKQGGLGDVEYPLLSDKTCTIARDYGVYKDDEGVAFRGLFIIDDKGNLRQITINDLPVGRSVDETLRLVQAFQFTDKHGDVCPAGWKPGQDTMKPDVNKSKEYFAKH